MFKSPEILASIRASLDQLPDSASCKDLESIPLLSSMYAETLRFGVQIHIPRNAPHHELEVGGVRIQKNKLVMANTWLAHMDEAVWNTKGGEMPLDEFCAKRFLVDPEDPSSGPSQERVSTTPNQKAKNDGVRFSTDGLEGGWIPFGGRAALRFYPHRETG